MVTKILQGIGTETISPGEVNEARQEQVLPYSSSAFVGFFRWSSRSSLLPTEAKMKGHGMLTIRRDLHFVVSIHC